VIIAKKIFSAPFTPKSLSSRMGEDSLCIGLEKDKKETELELRGWSWILWSLWRDVF